MLSCRNAHHGLDIITWQCRTWFTLFTMQVAALGSMFNTTTGHVPPPYVAQDKAANIAFKVSALKDLPMTRTSAVLSVMRR